MMIFAEKVMEQIGTKNMQLEMRIDYGCIDCTAGTVPNDKNTGRCAYHRAKLELSK
jgi:hypothetical protein